MNTGMGCHFLFQDIFPTQESNQHLFYLLHSQGFFTISAIWEALVVYGLQCCVLHGVFQFSEILFISLHSFLFLFFRLYNLDFPTNSNLLLNPSSGFFDYCTFQIYSSICFVLSCIRFILEQCKIYREIADNDFLHSVSSF